MLTPFERFLFTSLLGAILWGFLTPAPGITPDTFDFLALQWCIFRKNIWLLICFHVVPCSNITWPKMFNKKFKTFDVMYLYFSFGISLVVFIQENILVEPWLFVRSSQFFPTLIQIFLTFFLFVMIYFLLQKGFFLFFPTQKQPFNFRSQKITNAMNFNEIEFSQQTFSWNKKANAAAAVY